MAKTSVVVRTQWLARKRAKRADVSGMPAPAALPRHELKQRSGLDLLREVVTGTLPAGPMNNTLDFFLAEIEPGRAVYEGNPRAEFFNLIGSVHGGWSAAILDSCVASAIHSVLPVGKGYTTVELKVNFVRAVTAECGPLRAEGKVINIGGRIGTAEGRLTDSAGRLYAHATTTCLFFDMSERKRDRG
ncbi:MAG: hypothetical protein A2W18_05740 [Candidatus Muproteobacteria bacterium RBG_16_60_9]|uniref:Thioesterase domain-containing protein n=1 Tax=Candidatus Muproteobacteria bacterium RBG_16_60_9 TaxID=1817755 RepID=A0A1F6V5D3_9PROT|nr:MAG: hypothetical protein A2W18_05740 [Candidatus Muproteobacteria bacterium RBG_16_60_9]